LASAQVKSNLDAKNYLKVVDNGMKIAVLSFFLCLSIKGFSQATIKSNEAKDHVGEVVYLDDHFISGKTFKDSIAVMAIGGNEGKSIVTVVVALKKHNTTPTDIKVINTFKASKAYFRGIILPTASGYTMIIDDVKNIYFRSPNL
jgi:hypothetical protein